MKLLGIISAGFDVTDQLLCVRQILEKNGSILRQYTSYS
jgi:hypothetical protein